MVASQQTGCSQIIIIHGNKLQQKDQFEYVGTSVSSEGRKNTEIASLIAQAKKKFQRTKSIQTNNHISIHTRRRALECCIEPILMYGCDAWKISKQLKNKLETTET